MNQDTRNNYRDYSLGLLAGIEQTISIEGTYFQVVKSLADIMLRFDDAAAITRQAGTGGPAQYTRVGVTSAVDQTVVVSLGRLQGPAPYDGKASLAGAIINSTVNIASTFASGADVAVPAGTQALVLAVNANRVEAFVQLDDAAPDFVRYGDSSVSAIKGLKLYPGDTLIASNKAALYIFNPNAVAVTIRGADGAT